MVSEDQVMRRVGRDSISRAFPALPIYATEPMVLPKLYEVSD